MNANPCAECRPKIVLNAQQAIEIYMLKPDAFLDISKKTRGHSNPIAEKYGVSPKAIRDIWNLKTWAAATKHLRALPHEDVLACDVSTCCPCNKVNPLLQSFGFVA
jgi:hypothetical protein